MSPAAYSSLASPKDDEPSAPVVPAEEESSETAHSSAEDEPGDELDEAPGSHPAVYSCGLEVPRVRHVYGMCMACAWHMQGMWTACAWHVRGTRMARAWHAHGTRLVFTVLELSCRPSACHSNLNLPRP